MTTCWLLSEDKAGMVNQCLGLAEALGVEPVWKRIVPRAPWKYLPPRLWFAPFSAPGPGSDALTPPWPDITIGCGRYAVGLALAIKRASGGRSFAVHIQDPKVDARRFDLIIVPQHDRLRGDNVIVTHGAMHRVTQARLDGEAPRFAPQLQHLPRPLVAVLVGGTNRRYRLEAEEARALGAQLMKLAHDYQAGIALSVSRRTSPAVTEELRRALATVPSVMWDGHGDNPYFAWLALADFIIVTCDSVSMVTEACYTGKPVYVVELPGGSRRFRAFHQAMRASGYTRRFEGRLEKWNYAPLRETESVAAELRARLQSRATA
ncbi:MAG: mitochondrial fission ELM1 family protein [Gammaproteobacteria bacterium]|nr:mitochondrial fission ELM1 family protein [Gammaproteobacteria bacterium]